MHNPLRGVVTSEHEDHGGYSKHRGRDIGTRDVNSKGQPVWVYGVGRPVYAAFSGRWKKIVRWSPKGNKTRWTWAPERTGNGGLIANPDGEGNGYNHVLVLPKWKEGDWIDEGALIGYLDLSGNMSAPHLHFEMWSDWRNPYSDYSPRIVFAKYGVDTMDDPTAPIIIPAAGKTNGTNTVTPEGRLSVSDINTILARLGTISAEQDAANKRLDSIAAERRETGLTEDAARRIVREELKDFHQNEKIFGWVDNTSGEEKKFAAVDTTKWTSVLFKRLADAQKGA